LAQGEAGRPTISTFAIRKGEKKKGRFIGARATTLMGVSKKEAANGAIGLLLCCGREEKKKG